MDHIFTVGVSGLVPAVANYRYNYDDGRANGIYIPKFRNINERHPNFIRGYGMQGSSSRGMLPTNLRQIPGFGAEYKKAVREVKDAAPFSIGMWGEMLPRRENRVTINKRMKDAWGIPAAHIECSHGDNERAMAADALESIQEMAHEAGFEVTRTNGNLAAPGLCIHEIGTARMGNDPKTSGQNPTLTMMAITARACEYIVDQHKKGNL
jgi:choline dehydrogenase-like flavoprotein